MGQFLQAPQLKRRSHHAPYTTYVAMRQRFMWSNHLVYGQRQTGRIWSTTAIIFSVYGMRKLIFI